MTTRPPSLPSNHFSTGDNALVRPVVNDARALSVEDLEHILRNNGEQLKKIVVSSAVWGVLTGFVGGFVFRAAFGPTSAMFLLAPVIMLLAGTLAHRKARRDFLIEHGISADAMRQIVRALRAARLGGRLKAYDHGYSDAAQKVRAELQSKL